MTAQLRDCVKRQGFMIHLFCCDGGIKLIIVYSSPPQTVFHPAELRRATRLRYINRLERVSLKMQGWVFGAPGIMFRFAKLCDCDSSKSNPSYLPGITFCFSVFIQHYLASPSSPSPPRHSFVIKLKPQPFFYSRDALM